MKLCDQTECRETQQTVTTPTRKHAKISTMPDKENFQHYQHLAAQSHHPQFNFWPHPTPFHAAQSAAAAAAAAAASGMSHQHNPFAQYYASNPGHHPFAAASAGPTASSLSGNPLSSSSSLAAQKYGHSPFFPSMAGGAAPNASHLNHPAFGLSPTSGAIPPNGAGCSSKWGPAPAYHGQANGNMVPSSAFQAFHGNGMPPVAASETSETSASKSHKFNGFTSGGTSEPGTMVGDKSQHHQHQHHQQQQERQQDRKKSAVEVMDIDVVHGRSEDCRPEDNNNKKSKSKG